VTCDLIVIEYTTRCHVTVIASDDSVAVSRMVIDQRRSGRHFWLCRHSTRVPRSIFKGTNAFLSRIIVADLRGTRYTVHYTAIAQCFANVNLCEIRYVYHSYVRTFQKLRFIDQTV